MLAGEVKCSQFRSSQVKWYQGGSSGTWWINVSGQPSLIPKRKKTKSPARTLSNNFSMLKYFRSWRDKIILDYQLCFMTFVQLLLQVGFWSNMPPSLPREGREGAGHVNRGKDGASSKLKCPWVNDPVNMKALSPQGEGREEQIQEQRNIWN